MNFQFILARASNNLSKYSVKNPKLDTEIILSKILNITRENLLLNLDKKISKSQFIKFNSLIERRKKKEPIAYILGYKDFWKSRFIINNSVLIPRPETELLIEETLKLLPKYKQVKILDIGTGSGCILISILKEFNKSKGVGIDISKEAIKNAKINAKMQHVQNRVKFINTNVDKYLHGKYDLIISNPPYIKKQDIKNLEEDVKNYEPNIAIDGGIDGFVEIKKVIIKSSNLLKKSGKLILEIGHNQTYKCIEILKKKGFYINKISKDLSGTNRCIIGSKI